MRKLWSDRRKSLVPVPVPVTEPGTGFHRWFRYRSEIQFRSGPSYDIPGYLWLIWIAAHKLIKWDVSLD